MPVSPSYAENLAVPIMGIYAEAERLLLERIGRSLAQGLDAPDWAERKLLEIQLTQAWMRRKLDGVTREGSAEIATALAKAYNRGQAGAAHDLAGLVEQGLQGLQSQTAGLPAIESLVAETIGNVTATHPRILRAVDDIYRQVVSQASSQILTGVVTRRDAAQSALGKLASQGVTGFTDARGRRWDLASYVEMATRTAASNAAVQGHTDTLQASGQDLVIVSDAPQECSLCRPWEGKVLSLSGVSTVGVPVAGTLDQARAAGLFHPGCRHSVGIYLPGITERPTRTADVSGDQARQQLRYLERQTRAWKRREAASLDDQAKREARQHVRAYQAKIRQHVAATSAKRQPQRERLGAR